MWVLSKLGKITSPNKEQRTKTKRLFSTHFYHLAGSVLQYAQTHQGAVRRTQPDWFTIQHSEFVWCLHLVVSYQGADKTTSPCNWIDVQPIRNGARDVGSERTSREWLFIPANHVVNGFHTRPHMQSEYIRKVNYGFSWLKGYSTDKVAALAAD